MPDWCRLCVWIGATQYVMSRIGADRGIGRIGADKSCWIGTSWINVQLADAVADMDEPKSAGRVFSRVVVMYGLGGCGQPTAVLRTLTEQL